MILTYHGHSTFKVKGKKGTVVIDPHGDYAGMVLPRISADIVTVSSDNPDCNEVDKVTGTARRKKPFIVTKAGEYEVGGISIFGVNAFRDNNQGVERGENIIYTILIDGVRVCSLGSLGHELTPEQLEKIGTVDVLLVPVGGDLTIDPELAVKTIRAIEPSIAVPMRYRTQQHNDNVFNELKTLDDFLKVYGISPEPVAKLVIDNKLKSTEETELVVLSAIG